MEDLQAAGGVARHTALDYLGFLDWWTASISGWDANLDFHTTKFIKALELHRFHKHGVLIDWTRDWHKVNIPNLIQHCIPMAYPWTTSLTSIPHFISLSPHVLQTYDKSRLEVGYKLHLNDLPDLQDELSMAKGYNHFLQDITNNGQPDPDVEFDDGWSYYMVDFQGWSRHSIPL